jgi:hypothetical protein
MWTVVAGIFVYDIIKCTIRVILRDYVKWSKLQDK